MLTREQDNKNSNESIKLIIRADDMGMTHSCNMAIKKCFEEGTITCAAIQAPAPWAQEAAFIAAKNPKWCIGVHLTTIGEWVGYRWRPVSPYDKVSSIVDDEGFLIQTVQGFYSKPIDYDQLEQEFLAQVDLVANKWGVNLGYIDLHYIDGSENNDKTYLEVVKRVAGKYNLPISGYGIEKYMKSIYMVEPQQKEETLIKNIESLTPDIWLLVTHILTDSAESDALNYANLDDFVDGGVGKYRSAEMNALLSLKVKNKINEKHIQLVDYSIFTNC